MTIEDLQQQVSKNVSKEQLTINDKLLGLPWRTGFFDLYKIDAINCTGVVVGGITDNQFTVSASTVTIQFGSAALSGIQGPGIIFSVDGSGDAQISFTYELQDCALPEALSKIFQIDFSNNLPSFVADLTITDLSITLSTSPASFQFSYQGSLTIFDGYDVTLSVTIGITKSGSDYVMTADGSITVAGQTFVITFSTSPADTSFTATWTDNSGSLDLTGVIAAIGFSSQYNLADDDITLSLALTSASFSYNTDGEQLSFSAVTSGGYTVDLGATSLSDYYAAISMGENFVVSTLSEDLTIFDGIQLDSILIAIAGFTDPSFPIPNTPFTGITQGIAIRSVLTMSSNDTTATLYPAVNYLSDFFGTNTIDISITYDDGDFSLTGELAGIGLNFPNAQNPDCTINDISVTISTEAPQLILSCGLTLDYDFDASPAVTSIAVTGDISFSCADDEATIAFSAYESTPISNPFGISGLTVNNAGIGIEGTIGDSVSIDVLLQGDFILGSGQNTITEDIGASISIDDGEINIPYLQSDTVGPFTLAYLWGACLPDLPVPPGLDDININILDFYFCDQPGIILPDGTTAAVGINFLANFSVGSIVTFASLSVNTDSISGNLEMSPISFSVGSDQIVSVTGNGAGNSTYDIAPGGPVISFDTNTDTYTASLDATILGLTENINASLTNDALNITFNQSIAGFSDASFAVNFTSITDMSLSCSVDVTINCSPNLAPYGNININAAVTGSLDVSFQNDIFSATITASFSWQGCTINLGPVDISANLTDLANIGSAITSYVEDNVASLFSDALQDVETYLGAIAADAITDGEMVVNLLYNVYGISDISTLLQDMYQVLSTAGNHIDGPIDFHLDQSLQVIPPIGFHADMGAHFDHDVLTHEDVSLSGKFDTPSLSLSLIDIGVNEHIDLSNANIHVDQSVPVGDSDHIDILGDGGSVGVNGTLGVSIQLPLNDFTPSISPKLSVHAHGDVNLPDYHGDVAGFHIDESVSL